MWEVYFAMEEVSRLGEGFRYVGEHVHHGLVDARPVWAAIDSPAILGNRG
jgi:hypothetical protein